jgi:NAD(P)-dependent dehydrogenase (short-subunit alcohol dehydrogenase family)
VIAQSLATHGAQVAVNYHASARTANELVAKLCEETGLQHVAVAGDILEAAGVREMVAAAAEGLHGSMDILVNNAGPFGMTPFSQLPEEEWDRIWGANVKAAYMASQLVAPGMRERGWGRIVNVSAASAYLRNHSVYGLAKEALIFLTEELALELGPEVTVNAVAPGQIAESADDIAGFDASFVERAVSRTPAGRLINRSEVAEVIAQLCAPPFDMLTGATLPLDGGWRFNRF